MARKRPVRQAGRPDAFAGKVIQAVVDRITILGRSMEVSFAATCVNFQKASDCTPLPPDVAQPVLMIGVCPTEAHPLRVDILGIAALFHKLDTVSAFTRLKGGRASCLRFNGYWEEDYYIALDVFLSPDPETMRGTC
ncbi:MAG: hypothetical protein ACLQNE_45835 [Thermoguttaceae bacterium]